MLTNPAVKLVLYVYVCEVDSDKFCKHHVVRERERAHSIQHTNTSNKENGQRDG